MKKIFLFMSALLALFTTGCSQEDFGPDNGKGPDEAGTHYMAVNLMSADAIGSRATDYENGSTDENKVTSVRFYFFDEKGEAVNVKLQGSTYVNYYDWTPGNDDATLNSDGSNVEKILNATIVINTSAGDKLPQLMAAVLNPNDKVAAGSLSLSQMKAIVDNYSATSLTSEGKFVMFNSVYGIGNAEFCAVPIEEKHLQKTQEDAKNNPVEIYVERSVAKVKLSFDDNFKASFENGMVKLKNKSGKEDLTVGGKQVYLKINTWGLTAETSEGRLVKSVNPTEWNKDYDWWNGEGSHRSFWAINSETAENKYFTYNANAAALDKALYTNENAEKKGSFNNLKPAGNSTKFMISGTLCDAEGNALKLVRHLGTYFVDDDNQTELKKSILNQLKAKGINFYRKQQNADNTTSEIGIDVSDIKIVAPEPTKQEESKKNCYVYAQLNTGTGPWFVRDGEDEIPANVNETLRDENKVDRALVWKDGSTYYYNPIMHNVASQDAPAGVVRNHVYKINVTGIVGFGTPVFDPTLVIYPETPENNEHYIAARINILSWRIVNGDYVLGN